jgi:hypothetical protein
VIKEANIASRSTNECSGLSRSVMGWTRFVIYDPVVPAQTLVEPPIALAIEQHVPESGFGDR